MRSLSIYNHKVALSLLVLLGIPSSYVIYTLLIPTYQPGSFEYMERSQSLALNTTDQAISETSHVRNKITQHGSDESQNCQNILSNLTRGRWVKKISLLDNMKSKEYQDLIELEQKIDDHLTKFRVLRGIHKRLWREDLRCGYFSPIERPNGSDWSRVGSWCNEKSAESCCSNETLGRCVSPSNLSNCECKGCIDMRKIIHADVSDWIPEDARCRYRKYNATEACDVMSKFKDIHFVGDSLMRKFFRAFLLHIAGDPEEGVFMRNFPENRKSLCRDQDQFYWKECRSGGSVNQLTYKESLCGGKGAAPFTASVQLYYNTANQGHKNFMRLLNNSLGKSKTLIMLGVGLHMKCDAKVVTEAFMQPMVDAVDRFYNGSSKNDSEIVTRWPRIVFVPPDTPGILKSPVHLDWQGKVACAKYSDAIKSFCDSHGIEVLDFRELTKGVHSYDGTHYGRAVNLMKVRFLLNYVKNLDS